MLVESVTTGSVLILSAEAYVSVATESTLHTTSLPKQLNSEKPLFPNCRNTSTWRLLNIGLYIIAFLFSHFRVAYVNRTHLDFQDFVSAKIEI
jgi:hypothetical protein